MRRCWAGAASLPGRNTAPGHPNDPCQLSCPPRVIRLIRVTGSTIGDHKMNKLIATLIAGMFAATTLTAVAADAPKSAPATPAAPAAAPAAPAKAEAPKAMTKEEKKAAAQAKKEAKAKAKA